MERETIFIKGMVCNRCMLMVRDELEKLGLESVEVSLGEASFVSKSENYKGALQEALERLGFSILEDRKTKVAGDVKRLVAEVYSGDFDFPDNFRFSKLVSEKLGAGYEAISDAFIASATKTIEQYIIEFRINKVKELLVYSTLTLADIAFKLNFNSAAHLSAQFKQQTGLTPSFFKGIKKDKAGGSFSEN